MTGSALFITSSNIRAVEIGDDCKPSVARTAMAHLGSVLHILADLAPGDRCKAFDDALSFFNSENPTDQIIPIGGVYTEILHRFDGLDSEFDTSNIPVIPLRLTVEAKTWIDQHASGTAISRDMTNGLNLIFPTPELATLFSEEFIDQ